MHDYELVAYEEQAVSTGANSKALAYIQLKDKNDTTVFGAGLDDDISIAAIKAVLSAVNRFSKQ